ncbi:hypothetical protein CYY_000616 [Polysphondylium violaceum]|uniref:D-alanyl-D-alanine carboxypeptidase/D-alanyl-D-alanine-endopeptidase n=1 Tax=Polysphondylium violaceum TaxID=133409 RepID=A0A8J4Q2G7_9MYCE|nr:hypothetical protein CYY_000616 [Polysphondylium violaceum]
MKLQIVILICFVLLNVTTSYASISPSDVAGQIESILSNCSMAGNNCYGTSFGIVVDMYDLSTQQFTNLYNLNDEMDFTPASSTKLLTTTTIFYTFGEDFVALTPFFTDKPYNADKEDLDFICVKGQGDPSFNINSLVDAAQFFSKAGSVNNLIIDNTFYQGDPVPQNWEWADLTSGYGAIPTPLMINENTMNVFINPTNQGAPPTISFQYPGEDTYLPVINLATTGAPNTPNTIQIRFRPASPFITIMGSIPSGSAKMSKNIPILNPEAYFLNVFGSMLKDNGVTIRNTMVGSCNNTGYDYKSFQVVSPPLNQMLNYTLLVSDNIYAETFLRLLGTTNTNPNLPAATTPTYLRGLDTIQSTLGIDTTLYTQDDGCGLSRQNFITPKALVSVVEGVYTNAGDPNHDFISFLPVSAVSGTLKRRFINTSAQGIVHAKTGSMTGVDSLTGVILQDGIHQNDPNIPIIFFSIIANNENSQVNGKVIPIIDEIIVLLSQVTSF